MSHRFPLLQCIGSVKHVLRVAVASVNVMSVWGGARKRPFPGSGSLRHQLC